MKFTFHNSFIRYEEHIAANCDSIIREIFNKVIAHMADLYPTIDISVDYEIPKLDEFKSKDTLFDSSVAPRIWADVYVEWRPDIADDELLNILLSPDLQNENKYSSTFFEIIHLYEYQLGIALLAANISSPGSASYSGGYLHFSDGTVYLTLHARNNYIAERKDKIESLGWPKIINVTFENVWSWINPILNRSPDIGNSRTSRALAAYSMVACGAEEWRSQLLLFWAMMGLEALYCDGSEGLKHQLFEKSQVILGPIRENKKLIKKMYDTRSAFVHGSMNIPYIYAHDYVSEEVEHFRNEISDTSRLAIQMLVVTLQFMAINKIEELNFKYRLDRQIVADTNNRVHSDAPEGGA